MRAITSNMREITVEELRENFEDLVRDELRSYEGNYIAEKILDAFDDVLEAIFEMYGNG